MKARREVTWNRPRAAFVVNRPVPRSRLAGEVDDALATFGIPILNARFGNRVAFMTATNDGLTVFETDRGRARDEAAAVIKEIKALF